MAWNFSEEFRIYLWLCIITLLQAVHTYDVLANVRELRQIVNPMWRKQM